MSKSKKKYGDVVSFLDGAASETSRKDGTVKLAVKQGDYMTFLKDQGIPKDAAKQLAEANQKYHNGNIAFSTDILGKSKDLNRVTINTRTPAGVVSIRTTRSAEANNPQTGQRMTKYGAVSLRVAMKSGLDKELLDECSKEIEKASK